MAHKNGFSGVAELAERHTHEDFMGAMLAIARLPAIIATSAVCRRKPQNAKSAACTPCSIPPGGKGCRVAANPAPRVALRRHFKVDVHTMSLEKILFAFVIVLALTLNVGFVFGNPEIIAYHDPYDLCIALVVSLIATVMKFGERSLLGSTMLATSLVADVQLIAAALVWGLRTMNGEAVDAAGSVMIVSLAAGAMVANVVSVVLLVIETASLRR